MDFQLHLSGIHMTVPLAVYPTQKTWVPAPTAQRYISGMTLLSFDVCVSGLMFMTTAQESALAA